MTSVSPAEPPRDLRRAAEYVVASGDTATAANWLRTAADAIESRNALLHGADEAAALLAVGERDKADAEQFRKALTDVGLPEDASVDDLIRHHRNNVYLTVTFDQIAERERDRRQIAQLTEAGDSLAAVAAQFMDTGRGDLDGCLLSWGDIASAVRADEDYVVGSGDTATAANALRSAADQIERLTEALRQIASPRTIGSRDVFKAIARDTLAAVLADKEDAGYE